MYRGRSTYLDRLGLGNFPFLDDDRLELLYNFSNSEKEPIDSDYYNTTIYEKNLATSDAIWDRSTPDRPWGLGDLTGTDYRSGINGSAIFFDGIDDHIGDVWGTEEKRPKVRNNNYSAFVWFKILDIDNNQKQKIWDLLALGPQIFEYQGDVYYQYNAGDTWYNTSSSLNEGEWVFIVGQLNDKTMELYKNSELKDTNSISGDNTFQRSTHVFGYDKKNNSQYFNGLVDMAGYFGRSLTQAEINKLYDATKPEGHKP